jgi:hypothetical protein
MAVADAQGSVCISNISASERRKRLIGGIVPLLVALLVLAVLVITGTDRWWRLALFPLFWAAGSGIFQWRDRT